MGSAHNAPPQKGWVDLAFDNEDFGRKWVVLDNGVLWVHRDNAGLCTAEQVIPLHEAEVQFTSATSSLDVVVGLGTKGMLTLRPASTEGYRHWTSAMLDAAQLWHARRQMALMAVLPAAAAGRPLRATDLSPSGSSPSGIADGRRRLLAGLSHFLVQVGALRDRTRRAVTRTQRHPHDVNVSADLNLPRFLRRAIADTLEKIWRACGRAYACAGVLDDGGDPLSVYDAVLVLREAVDSFVTYCSLLKDLQVMLRDGEVQPEDALPFSPLSCLASLRDILASLSQLIRCPEEELRQRSALAAVDATLQRCWTELSKRPLDKDLDATTVIDGAPTAAPSDPGQDPGTSGWDSDSEERASASSPCSSFKGSARVRRLASKLQRDVVRTSVRLARKRARAEGQALLPDQPLDDSLENADVLEMTALTTVSSTSSEASGGTATQSPPSIQTRVRALDKQLPYEAASAPPAQRLSHGLGGSLSLLNANLYTPVYSPRTSHRRWQDPSLLRRRRLVRMSVDFDDFDDSDSDEKLPYSAEKLPPSEASKALHPNVTSDNRQASVEPMEVDSEVRQQRVASVREDLGVLDIPVTPATPNGGGRRALWCETMEVQISGLLDRLNTSESALQEAKFEVLSSEESYLRSLDLLAHRLQAMDALLDPCVISDQDRDAVFKFLDTSRACSMRFVSALRALWSLDVMMRGLCTMMHKEAMPGASLQQYVLIVSLQPRAASVLSKIGSMEASQLIPLLSLPAQRASRLPLLLGAILRRLDQRTSEAVICRAALDRLNQIVFECNEALRRAEQTERIAELGRMLKVAESPRNRLSWNDRKSNLIGRAKSFFLKSNIRVGAKTSKILTSTSSMLHLT